MKVAASILSILSGLLQLVVCILLGAGRFVISDPIEKVLYSPDLFVALSCLLIIMGVLVIKFPRISGGILVLLGTGCFFMGSLMFAPLSIIGGIIALTAPIKYEKLKSRKTRLVTIGLTAFGFVMIVAGNVFAIYVWNKQPDRVENVAGISITADQLTREYTTDEKAADAKYLNKAIEVSGTVIEVNNNQDGGIMLVLKSTDPTTCVQCTLRDKGAKVTTGQNVIVKGFCSGNGITGVTLTDCVMK